MSEEYSVGYSEGYQDGWNAAMDATPPAASTVQPVQEMTVVDPADWVPCTPEWISQGGDCDKAPRVWNAKECNHYHPATPPAAQRQWVGLTDEDKLNIEMMGGKSDVMLAEMVEAKLKERNV
jgi:hypothetical protein